MANPSVSHRGVSEDLISSSSTSALATGTGAGTTQSQSADPFVAEAKDAVEMLTSEIAESTVDESANL